MATTRTRWGAGVELPLQGGGWNFFLFGGEHPPTPTLPQPQVRPAPLPACPGPPGSRRPCLRAPRLRLRTASCGTSAASWQRRGCTRHSGLVLGVGLGGGGGAGVGVEGWLGIWGQRVCVGGVGPHPNQPSTQQPPRGVWGLGEGGSSPCARLRLRQPPPSKPYTPPKNAVPPGIVFIGEGAEGGQARGRAQQPAWPAAHRLGPLLRRLARPRRVPAARVAASSPSHPATQPHAPPKTPHPPHPHLLDEIDKIAVRGGLGTVGGSPVSFGGEGWGWR